MTIQSTELTRFVMTRPVQLATESSPLGASHGSPFSPVTHVDATASTFYALGAGIGTGDLKAALPAASRVWDMSEAKLETFAHGPSFLASKAAITAQQPGLDALAREFVADRANRSLAELISSFEKGAKQSVKEYAQRTKLKENLVVLWDNLIVRAASKRNLDLVPALVEAIRLSNIIYRAATKPSDMLHVSAASASVATVALPAAVSLRPIPDNLCLKPIELPPCDGNVSIPWPNTKGAAQPLGWGDLKMIKSSLLRYAPAEIAHIESILKGEAHVREFRDLRSSKTTDELENETQSELTSSLESTEKSSFEHEVAVASSQSTDTAAEVNASYEYGKVPTGLAKVSGNFAYQGKSTKEESQKTATKYAKDVVASATSKLTQRVRSFRSVTTTTEKENKTTHTFDNIKGQTHVSGVYYWLDKYYLAHVENYGQRLLYEFAVPEPAAFFRYAKLKREEADLIKPTAPRDFQMPRRDAAGHAIPNQYYALTDFSALTRENYNYWLAQYGATSATPPPVQQYVSWAKAGGTNFQLTTVGEQIEIPVGYVAKIAVIVAQSQNTLFNGAWVNLWLADNYFDQGLNAIPFNMGDKTGKIPVSLISYAVYAVNITIQCELNQAGFDSWRITIFETIMQAYARQMGEYEDKIQQKAADRTNAAFGMNPGINRQTEQIELRKSCIEIVTEQRFESIDAMRDTIAPPGHFGYPEFSFSEARNEGTYIQFLEKAFEWINMTYSFAPYFWTRKDRWLDILKIGDVDPLFENFLRAGSARVVVPVRPGYEKDVLDLFTFGWSGMQHPFITIDDPRYVSIVEELKEQAGLFPGMHIEPERWVVKVPTTLVYLDNPETKLPDYTRQLWWQPRLRVMVMDSLAKPVSSAMVTLRYLKPDPLPPHDLVEAVPPISLASANGSVPGAYDFLVDEGTYKIEVTDVVGGASLPVPGTAVIEMFQNAEVAITLWRLGVAVTDASASPVANAMVNLNWRDAAGHPHVVQLVGANGTLPGVYDFMVNPGTYTVDVGPLGATGNPTTLQVFEDTALPMAA